MMTIIRRPESYDDTLERIFWCSLGTGCVCTYLLASAWPSLRALIESVKGEAEIGPVNGLPTMLVFIPLVFALVSRMVCLHEWISRVLRIRATFDNKSILFPLCQRSGVALSGALMKEIKHRRDLAMSEVFYKYASFTDPKIDTHLVRTAADRWGWFWVLTESSFLLSATLLVLYFWPGRISPDVLLCALLLEFLLMLYFLRACISSAGSQVGAILAEPERKRAVSDYFSSLVEDPTPHPPAKPHKSRSSKAKA
jgi:hypothetical protein